MTERDPLSTPAVPGGLPFDASQIQFSQATVYPAGTLGAHDQSILSVKDAPFNAIGNGVTDDTAAIQAAIDALSTAGGGRLWLPRGTYLHATGLTWKDGVNPFGDGKRASILKYSGAGIGNDTSYTAADARIKFCDFQITAAASTIGLRFTNASDVVLDGVEINGGPSRTGNTTAALQFAPSGGGLVLNVMVNKCNIHENVGYGISSAGLANDVNNRVSVTDSMVRANAINIQGTGEQLNWTIIGCNLEAGQTDAIKLTDCVALTVLGCYFEQTIGTNGINLPAGVTFNSAVIKGNFLSGTTGGAGSTGIILGAAGFAIKGVDVSGNYLTGWTTGINPVNVGGGSIGPNSFSACTADIAAPGANCAGVEIQQDSGVWDFYGTGGLKNGRANLGIAQIVKSYTALSASDVDIALGNSLLINVRDTTNGGTAAIMYENTQAPVILGQAGATTFVTGVPAAGQIQVKNRGASGGVAVLANANRNNAVLNVSLIVTQP